MRSKSISAHTPKKSSAKIAERILFAVVCLLLLLYLGIFAYLNMYKYTQHVDSDIAVDAMLAREIWTEKDLTPDNWISSTERRVLGVPTLSALFYGMSGSMVFSMGLSCAIVGGLLLVSIAFTLKHCQISRLGIATALLALCALPINGLRNDGQMVPFVMLLWFLFADYYALHSICLFLCIGFYLYLRDFGNKNPSLTNLTKNKGTAGRRNIARYGLGWLALMGLCGGLALGGMRCLQVVILPLFVWEVLLLFFESDHLAKALPRGRWLAAIFILSLLGVGVLAKLYPSSVDYPMYIQDGGGMADRLTRIVPGAVLECLGIAGNCKLNSFAALMQLGILAVLALTVYGLFFLFSKKSTASSAQKMLLQALGTSFLFTVFIEVVTNAEAAHNYFFVIWFVIAAVLAVLITHFEKAAPRFAGLIALCVCIFSICNVFYTYKDCITVEDNLKEYEEVIEYIDSQDIRYGYAEFWDASRICIMTDGRITMGHCYHMEDLRMYWWITSTKWYVPNLPELMSTAYVVRIEDKAAFEAQFPNAAIVSLGFENERFAVYTSEYNLVPMI
ncbi:MAG: hypothetical protein K2K10_00205 [Acetatifactor sp.]|nr:hypothetical protein [Acetatifactor sp.]